MYRAFLQSYGIDTYYSSYSLLHNAFMMNTKGRILIVAALLILLAFPVTARNLRTSRGPLVNPRMELTVLEDRTVIEEDGEYIVKTTLSGPSIRQRFGVDALHHTARSTTRPPERDRVSVREIEIIDPRYGIPCSSKYPRWTYEAYGAPLLRFTVFVRADPINLVFNTGSEWPVSRKLGRDGWERCPTWRIYEANINFVPYRGRMYAQDSNYFKDRWGGERYHLRTWDLGSFIVGQAHVDTPIPHKACKYENAEAQVASAFWYRGVRRNALWLANTCRDCLGYWCNGWATNIRYL